MKLRVILQNFDMKTQRKVSLEALAVIDAMISDLKELRQAHKKGKTIDIFYTIARRDNNKELQCWSHNFFSDSDKRLQAVYTSLIKEMQATVFNPYFVTWDTFMQGINATSEDGSVDLRKLPKQIKRMIQRNKGVKTKL